MIWERIRQKNAEAERARLEEARRQKAEEEERLRQARERKAKATEEERARMRHLMTLLHESRLIQHMAELRRGISAGKTDVVFDGDRNEITLIWGRYHIEYETELILGGYTLKKGNISYSSITRVKDFSYITTTFYLDDGSLEINDRKIPREKWRSNQNLIIDALADAYLNPRRQEYIKKGEGSSGGGSSSTECCCSH